MEKLQSSSTFRNCLYMPYFRHSAFSSFAKLYQTSRAIAVQAKLSVAQLPIATLVYHLKLSHVVRGEAGGAEANIESPCLIGWEHLLRIIRQQSFYPLGNDSSCLLELCVEFGVKFWLWDRGSIRVMQNVGCSQRLASCNVSRPSRTSSSRLSLFSYSSLLFVAQFFIWKWEVGEWKGSGTFSEKNSTVSISLRSHEITDQEIMTHWWILLLENDDKRTAFASYVHRGAKPLLSAVPERPVGVDCCILDRLLPLQNNGLFYSVSQQVKNKSSMIRKKSMISP